MDCNVPPDGVQEIVRVEPDLEKLKVGPAADGVGVAPSLMVRIPPFLPAE